MSVAALGLHCDELLDEERIALGGLDDSSARFGGDFVKLADQLRAFSIGKGIECV